MGTGIAGAGGQAGGVARGAGTSAAGASGSAAGGAGTAGSGPSAECGGQRAQGHYQLEDLDRGLVAVRVDGGHYVGRRMLGYEYVHLGPGMAAPAAPDLHVV